jgi:hypothetical protein
VLYVHRDARLGTPRFRGERQRKFSLWWVVNHTEISNYPYCLSNGSDARCACRATHISAVEHPPSQQMMAACCDRPSLASPSVTSPVPCGPATFPSPSLQTQVWRQADVAAKKLCTMAGFQAMRCIAVVAFTDLSKSY